MPNPYTAPKPRAEIDQEKADKPRPDLLPATALMAAGRVMAYGLRKHGECTWRVAGTEQADSRTHVASMVRHALEVANDIDVLDDESGLEQLACVITQACIAYDCRVAEQMAALERTRAAGPPVSVGSAFAAGAIEGEKPIALPDGWEWGWSETLDEWYATDGHKRMFDDEIHEIADIVRRRNRNGVAP